MTHNGPVWPAVIKHQGEDELMYLGNDKAWLQAVEHLVFGAEDDVLIDSQGQLYIWDAAIPVLQAKGSAVTLEGFSQMLKKHMVALNQCCVSKLHIDTIAQGLQMVKDTVEDRS